MLAKYLKAPSKKILLPIIEKIPRIVDPNHITFLGAFFSAIAGILFGLGKIRIAGLLLLVAGFFDTLDGAYSRFLGRTTKFGAFLDSIFDRYSDLFIIGGITFYFASLQQLLYVFLSTMTLAGFVMISYTKARAENIIASCNIGLMERPERILVLSAGSMINRIRPTIWILAILCHHTAIHRILFTHKEIGTEWTRGDEKEKSKEGKSRYGSV